MKKKYLASGIIVSITAVLTYATNLSQSIIPNPKTPNIDQQQLQSEYLNTSTIGYLPPPPTINNISNSVSDPIIRNQYIVILNHTASLPDHLALKTIGQYGGKILHVYNHITKGFAIALPQQASDAFLNAMQRNPQVRYVEQDSLVHTDTIQDSPSWGLDRIDQRNLPLDHYYHFEHTGSGVNSYIVDTGILKSHQEFIGRLQSGYSAINDANGTNDCDGHGTHVAGIIGGSTYGVAKNVTLTPVRVLDCNGSGAMSGVIAGLDWIMKNGRKPAVVNLSLGGSTSSTLDNSIEQLYRSGFVPVVAAGNSNRNACNSSPARAANAITVAATDKTDTRASYSNYGSCVDLFAPGSQIVSAWIGSNTATATASGTSMAAPHVAGVAALLLEQNATATPKVITDQLLTQATANLIKNVAGSPNRLLYNLGQSQSSPPTSSPTETTTNFVYIKSLTGSSMINLLFGSWKANVDIQVLDANHQVVSNAIVSGDFTTGGTSIQCTTNSFGECSLTSGTISRTVNETTYTVTSITGNNLVYAPNQNLVSSVTIYR